MEPAFFLLLSYPLLISCEGTDPVANSNGDPVEDFSTLTISQGIAGHVWFWKGDFQPSTGGVGGSITPVERWILVFPELAEGDVVHIEKNTFFSIPTVLVVDSVRSDSIGFYEVPLPPGAYALFVREKGLLYANPRVLIPVLPDSVSRRRLDISYEAVF